MLKSTQNKDPEITLRVLSDIVQEFTPNPGVISRTELNDEEGKLRELILQEAMSQANLSKENFSQDDQKRLLSILSKEISGIVFRNQKETQIQARLGEAGDLNLDLYNIQYDTNFQVCLDRGVRQSHVESAIRKPDQIEYVHEPVEGELDSDKVIIFSKAHISNKKEDCFLLLVLATRKKDNLLVHSAWRVYVSDVDLATVHSPLEVFRKFIDIYGAEFSIADLKNVKFILHQVIGVGPDEQLKHDVKFSYNVRPYGMLHYRFLVNKILNCLYVTIGYFVDLDRYDSSLRAHNVQVSKSASR